MSEHRSEQELVRLQKLSQLRELGYPYPNDVELNADSQKIHQVVGAETEREEAERTRFKLAGRLMAFRLMGKAAFCHIQDRAGRIQLYVRRDDVGEDAFKQFKTFDVGDIVEASGFDRFSGRGGVFQLGPQLVPGHLAEVGHRRSAIGGRQFVCHAWFLVSEKVVPSQGSTPVKAKRR